MGERHSASGSTAETGSTAEHAGDVGDGGHGEDTPTVYGDNACGTGGFQDRLEQAGIESKCETQQPVAAGGLFAKDRFDIDLEHDTVTCPAGNSASIQRGTDGSGTAHFAAACTGCPLREQCTTAAAGRSVSIRSPTNGNSPTPAPANKTRTGSATTAPPDPKVERKIGHLMRRHYDGRRARVRGQTKTAADFALLAAAVNLARLAVLAVPSPP